MQHGVFIIDENSINLNRMKEENIRVERTFIVDFMRLWADNFDIKDEKIYIPDECEKYGFVEGKHNVGQMMRFFADMLEE